MGKKEKVAWVYKKRSIPNSRKYTNGLIKKIKILKIGNFFNLLTGDYAKNFLVKGKPYYRFKDLVNPQFACRTFFNFTKTPQFQKYIKDKDKQVSDFFIIGHKDREIYVATDIFLDVVAFGLKRHTNKPLRQNEKIDRLIEKHGVVQTYAGKFPTFKELLEKDLIDFAPLKENEIDYKEYWELYKEKYTTFKRARHESELKRHKIRTQYKEAVRKLEEAKSKASTQLSLFDEPLPELPPNPYENNPVPKVQAPYIGRFKKPFVKKKRKPLPIPKKQVNEVPKTQANEVPATPEKRVRPRVIVTKRESTEKRIRPRIRKTSEVPESDKLKAKRAELARAMKGGDDLEKLIPKRPKRPRIKRSNA